ncbi:acyl-coenzyme A thioesterase 13 isoform X1 [Macadamia integrifolia]|uniref:acyl-coenzyme A thioesterase 13 isoform X1 n=1 Tax=Macadamia integrifolia TaxID=60698 RepID=UPI001C4F7598|nr:acyl-coenzyme A thioesterase 13 isoform X1 [Macadamia integrifolia]
MMEKAREALGLTKEESEAVSQLTIHPREANSGPSFYEAFALRGIRVDRVEPGFVACTFKVPPRLTQDASGNLSPGAIVGLVDEVGAAAIHIEGFPIEVSVDMSIAYLSAARANDELEVTSKALGCKGCYFGTIVQLKNKATGEVVAEGRHSLYGKARSKI